jgi:hypothetical protein
VPNASIVPSGENAGQMFQLLSFQGRPYSLPAIRIGARPCRTANTSLPPPDGLSPGTVEYAIQSPLRGCEWPGGRGAGGSYVRHREGESKQSGKPQAALHRSAASRTSAPHTMRAGRPTLVSAVGSLLQGAP